MSLSTTPEDKTKVPGEFDRAARRYDLLTGLNPGYQENLRRSAARLELDGRPRILDLCCGTGRSTEALLSHYPGAEIVGLDASFGMLEGARKKALGDRVSFVLGDATDPVAAGVEGTFDAIFAAYGIRNVPDPDVCLKNLYALLKPMGRLGLHEYTLDSAIPGRRAIWNAITIGVVIPGGLFSHGSTKLYRYLRKSVLDFDDVRTLEKRVLRAGFANIKTTTMEGWQRGIVHTITAERPKRDPH